jgi:hypothetical protein
LTKNIVKYAERATAAESKVSELESHLSTLELGNQHTQQKRPISLPMHQPFNTQHARPPLWYHLPTSSGEESNNHRINHMAALDPNNIDARSDGTTGMDTAVMVEAPSA